MGISVQTFFLHGWERGG